MCAHYMVPTLVDITLALKPGYLKRGTRRRANVFHQARYALYAMNMNNIPAKRIFNRQKYPYIYGWICMCVYNCIIYVHNL